MNPFGKLMERAQNATKQAADANKSPNTASEPSSEQEQALLDMISKAGIELEELRFGANVIVLHVYMSHGTFKTALNVMPMQVSMDATIDLAEFIEPLTSMSASYFDEVRPEFAQYWRLWVMRLPKDQNEYGTSRVIDARIAELERQILSRQNLHDVLTRLKQHGSLI